MLPTIADVGTETEPPARATDPNLLLGTGDGRAQENVFLANVHLVFARRHNWHSDRLAADFPDADERFQEARKWTIAEYQNIVMYEWFSALGSKVRKYYKFIEDLEPFVDVASATAGLRSIGHNMVRDKFPILNPLLQTDESVAIMQGIENGSVAFAGTTFGPLKAPVLYGLLGGDSNDFHGNVIRSMVANRANSIDGKVSDALRNIPHAPYNLDILAFNLFRASSLGAPSYMDVRRNRWPRAKGTVYGKDKCGEEYRNAATDRRRCFQYITGNEDTARALKRLYAKLDNMDLFVGLSYEKRFEDSLLGRTQEALVRDTFERLRDSDYWWFENHDNGLFSNKEIDDLRTVTLAQIYSDVFPGVVVQPNAFEAPPATQGNNVLFTSSAAQAKPSYFMMVVLLLTIAFVLA